MMDVLSSFGMIGTLLLVLAGLVLLAILVIAIGRRSRRSGTHGMAPGHRLAIIDQVQIDETRRLVLIQRDEVQHLVILGGGSDFLVESGIGARREAVTAPAHSAPDIAEPRATETLTTGSTSSTPRPPEDRGNEPAPRPAPALRAPSRDARDESTGEPAAPVTSPAPAGFAATRSAPDFSALPPRRPLATPVSRNVETSEKPSAPVTPSARAEPVLSPPAASTDAPVDTTPRVSVKVDPFFAEMAEPLEETLRRPSPAAGSAARRAPASPSFTSLPEERSAPPLNTTTPPVAPSVSITSAMKDVTEAESLSTPPISLPVQETQVAAAAVAESGTVPEQAPAKDPFEEEMANLLGRSRS